MSASSHSYLGENIKDRDSPSSKTSASDNELSSEPIFASKGQRDEDVRDATITYSKISKAS